MRVGVYTVNNAIGRSICCSFFQVTKDEWEYSWMQLAGTISPLCIVVRDPPIRWSMFFRHRYRAFLWITRKPKVQWVVSPNAIYGQLVCNRASFSYCTALKLWSHSRLCTSGGAMVLQTGVTKPYNLTSKTEDNHEWTKYPHTKVSHQTLTYLSLSLLHLFHHLSEFSLFILQLRSQ